MEKIAKPDEADAQGLRKSESLAACHLNEGQSHRPIFWLKTNTSEISNFAFGLHSATLVPFCQIASMKLNVQAPG